MKMELKDFILSDDFYNLSNDAKLLYFYLVITQDEKGNVECNDFICDALNVHGEEYNQLVEAGLIEMDDDGYEVTVKGTVSDNEVFPRRK